MAHPPKQVLAAIDVGTNAVRLKLARALPDGTLETLHQERDPIRPGEGVFASGGMKPATARRLIATLRRYASHCRRYKAVVRAVATSALRSSRNKEEILRRVRAEAGLRLEIISGQEEARLICLGVLHGEPPGARSVVIDIGGGSTEVVVASGQSPLHLYSATLGAVRLAETFEATGDVSEQQLALMREYAQEVLGEALPRRLPQGYRRAVGTSGTLQAVIAFASGGKDEASPGQLTDAVEHLVELGARGRAKRFEARRADVIVSGAVILEAVVRHLRLKSVRSVELGLRDGILRDLQQRAEQRPEDPALADAATAVGRRFAYDEAHAQQVCRLALQLFDALPRLHQLPSSARPYLQAAALLHDVGSAVSPDRHHKHSEYLITHADLPGLSDREHALVAKTARFHRRSPPELDHRALAELEEGEAHLVRKLATLLRVADSLDRSHHQPVRSLEIRNNPSAVALTLRARGPVELELWDAAHETSLFKRVFGKKLSLA